MNIARIDPAACARRRERVMDAIGDGIAVVFGSPEVYRNADCAHLFRQNSHMLWLTGFSEPDAVLVLDGGERTSILFAPPKDPDMEVWTGIRLGPEGVEKVLGLDEGRSLDDYEEDLPDLLRNRSELWSFFGDHPEREAELLEVWFGSARPRGSERTDGRSAGDLRRIVDPMRMIKDETEIALMKEAGRVSALGHERAMRMSRAGLVEWEIEAEILGVFACEGCRFPAYGTIVASGANACVLHYVSNDSVLKDGDLVLIDAGAECAGYAGDVSRTYPVSGRFSEAQRRVYEAVLRVNEAVIQNVRPGKSLTELNTWSQYLISKELVDLGLVRASLEETYENGLFKRYYMHGIGHYLGLDVHDVGPRSVDGEPVPLEKNMFFTVEPGIYIPDAEDVPAEYRGIGVRIEDDVMVTQDGCEVYTDGIPKDPDEVEALCDRS